MAKVWGSVSLSLFPDSPPSSVRVGSDHVDVFDGNFFSVMNEVRANIDAGFCYVALDTEYPGCVVNTQDFSPHDFAAVAQSVVSIHFFKKFVFLFCFSKLLLEIESDELDTIGSHTVQSSWTATEAALDVCVPH